MIKLVRGVRVGAGDPDGDGLGEGEGEAPADWAGVDDVAADTDGAGDALGPVVAVVATTAARLDEGRLAPFRPSLLPATTYAATATRSRSTTARATPRKMRTAVDVRTAGLDAAGPSAPVSIDV
jgi:hypothetical protein